MLSNPTNSKLPAVKKSAKDSKFLRLVLAGILGTLAFNFAMYADISITGVPLDIANILGQLTVGESELAPIVGHAIHLGNGIGLALLFGYVALPISKRIIRLPIMVYALAFVVIELVVATWFGLFPALGAGVAGLNIAPEVPVMTLFRHIVFGLVLGVSVRR